MPSGTDERPGLTFLICPDAALLKRQIDNLLRKHPPASGDWKKNVFWGDEAPESKFWESLKQQGLFTENRAIITRKAHLWSAQVWKSLDERLSSGTASIWPIFCLECEYEKKSYKIPQHIKKSRCFSFSEKKGWLWFKPPLQGVELHKYVKSEAEKRKIKFTDNSLAYFCNFVRPDAELIGNELDKLALVFGDKAIPSPIPGLEGASLEANVFSCIKNIYIGNREGVLREVSHSDSDSFLFFLIAMLAKDFQVLWQIQSGETPQKCYDLPLKQRVAKRLGRKKLSQAFVLLANAEYQVKSGKLHTEQVLDSLLAELEPLFSQSA